MQNAPATLFKGALPLQRTVCRSCLRQRLTNRLHIARQARLSPQCRALQTQSTPEPTVIPFRKQLKDKAKASKSSKPSPTTKDPRLEEWELTVGLEIHAELHTPHKLFSRARTSTNDAPNTHVALFDAAFPGTQPSFQNEVLIPAIRAALALGCTIQRKSSWDRKHYFWRDQPQGYQITQYYEPFARDGQLVLYAHDGIAPEDGESITVGIKQVQMEQDTAKTVSQPGGVDLLDFNRVSTPLVEIITAPVIHHAKTAAACVRKIQAVLRAVDACVVGMEMGGLRADVNVSVRRRGRDLGSEGHSYYGVGGLGQRTEIKNLSSFKAVEDAIVAERDRQIAVLEAGGVIEGETRGWTLGSTETRRLRGKEGEVDYRYMPDPDLAPVLIGSDLVDHLKENMPTMPDEMLQILTTNPRYALTVKDAKTLLSLDDGDRVEYYMEAVELLEGILSEEERSTLQIGKMAGNWVLHELGGSVAATERPWDANPVSPASLATLLVHLLRKQITGRTAKYLLQTLFNGDARSVEQILEEENLILKPMSDEDYQALAQELLDENPNMVKQIKDKGQRGKVMWFVGQMIRRGEEGRVEAQKAEAALCALLEL